MMAELFTHRPLFPGSSESDQIYKICQVLGTPTRLNWPQGFKLASQIGFKFPQCIGTSLRSLVPTASDDALDLIGRNIYIYLYIHIYIYICSYAEVRA